MIRLRREKEEGSALVLVMFVALLLTILGLAVLSSAMGGAQRSETRENDVQSLHLAQKGLDEAAAYIQTQLDGRRDIDPDHVEEVIIEIVKDVNTKIVGVSNGVSTKLNGAGGMIKSVTYEGKGEQKYKYYIDIAAEAEVNGVQRELRQQVVIDTYPDFLKYAFGSEKTLTLNGAPGLHGNIYAGKELVINNTAFYTYKGLNTLSKKTQYPRVELLKKNGGGAEAKPLPEVHVQSLESIRYTGDGAVDAKVTEAQAATVLPRILGITKEQVFIKPQKKFIQINVEESFLDKVTEALDGTAAKEEVKQNYDGKINGKLGNYLKSKLSNLPDPSPPYIKPVLKQDATEAEKEKYQSDYLDYLENVKNYQNSLLLNRSESAIYSGDLLIDRIDYKQLTFTDTAKSGTDSSKPKWLIVDGNLEINNYSSDTSDFLPVQANILVTGNVTIKGRVSFNSTMFVLGSTTVEDAVIQGLNNKELVLISKGDVLLNRIDAFTNQTTEMKAFYYTDSDANLYGVGSIFWLKGGFFAKGDLTVNAVLGDVSEPADPAQGFIFEDQERERAVLTQRFQIEYNPDVFTHQQASLPRVQQVNVTVGPLELVSR